MSSVTPLNSMILRASHFAQQATQRVANTRGLGWLGRILQNHHFWSANRANFARGAAIGVFFGLLLPFGHTPCVLLSCLLFRAYVPAAVLATFINTPITLPAIYWVAYSVGDWVVPGGMLLPSNTDLQNLVQTTAFGCCVLSVVFGILTFFLSFYLFGPTLAWWKRKKNSTPST